MYLPLRTIQHIRDKYKESFQKHTYVEYKVDDFGHITIKGTVLKQIVQCLNCIIS